MEVTFESYKKVTFRSYLSYDSSEAFANAIAMATPAGVPGRATLFWANGVLFRFFSYQPSEALTKEHISGNLLWDHVEFAPMPNYVKEIQEPERPLVTIYVLDVSKHTVLEPVARWIRENLIEKKTIVRRPRPRVSVGTTH